MDEEKWISQEHWNRVYSLYQIVPGPEAFELACYFGFIAKDRFAAFLGGLGFALPGVLLELLFSYLYVTYGFSEVRVRASFNCIQVMVAALIFKATHKIAEAALTDHRTKELIWDRGYIFLWNYLTSVCGLNFFASMGISGIMNMFFVSKEQHNFKYGPAIAYLISALTLLGYFLYIGYSGNAGSQSLVRDCTSLKKQLSSTLSAR